MSSYATQLHSDRTRLTSAAELAEAIRVTDFSRCAATVIGYGYMGRQYVEALKALGVKQIRVCSRSEAPLKELQNLDGIATFAGGYTRLDAEPLPGELGIVATPTSDLIAATKHLVARGFRNLLIEKPVSLCSEPIWELSGTLKKHGVTAACGYNRVAYPSFLEAKYESEQAGGITSCTYNFTEFVDSVCPEEHPDDEMARWGIANSLHVMSMAHGLIGMPKSWNGYKNGSISWHPTGSVFVGSGMSEREVPFSFHADWGSKSRWSVEVHTSSSSFRLCPLENLFVRTSAKSEWEEVPLVAFAPEVKAGVVEQVAAMLNNDIRQFVPLATVEDAAIMAAYGEQVFGYL